MRLVRDLFDCRVTAARSVRGIRFAGLAASVSLASIHGFAHVIQEPGPASQTISSEKRIEGVLSGGEVTRRSLVIDAGRAATIVVGHQDIDLIVRLYGSEKDPEIELASDGPTGELRMPVHATAAGPYTIEIAAAYSRSPAGKYTIRLAAVHPATAGDQQVFDADRDHSRATRLRSATQYAAALTDAALGLSLREKAFGSDAPEIARSLLLVAQLNDAIARYGIAEGLYVRARAIVERTPARYELLKATILDSHGASLIARGKLREAEPLVNDALAIRERILGPDHVLVAATLTTIADLHHENANVQEARQAAERALEIAARAYAPADVPLGDYINRVARSQIALGNFARAEQLYRESLEAREKSAGADSLAAAESIGGLARVALQSNDNVKSEQLHRRALAIREKILGADHPQVAGDLFNLGLIHYRRRDYPNALALYHRALATWEKTLGHAHRSIASSLNNLGLVYWRQGDYPRAEDFFRRSFELQEQLYGPDSLRVVSSLANLGIIAKETGNYELAESRYTRALAIQEKHLGADHPDLIALIESLGILYRDRGDYGRAEEMFARTIRISEASLGPDHAFVARHLGNLSRLYWAMGDSARALVAIQRLMAIEERNLPLNLSIGSERQKLAYFEPRMDDLEETISFHVQQASGSEPARDLALTSLLRRKGRVLDALADNWSAFRNRSKPDDRALLDRLARVTSELAATVLSGSTKTPLAERQKRVATLAAQREELEIEIHRRSAGYLEPTRPLSLPAVQAALPADGALVEFAVYRPFNPQAAFESGKQFGPPRYVAYVVRPSGGAGWKDLGSAEEIDQIVDRFRSSVADPALPGVNPLARELHQRLIAPLRPLFEGAAHLVISPDGPLNLIPFEALRSSEGRYLVETFAVSYVTTGRDLVRMLAPRPAANRAVIFADPAFGEPTMPATERGSLRATATSHNVTMEQDLSSVYFAPLAGTATEAQRIRELFPNVELKSGPRATETALKNVQAPRILHLATHGFFLEDSESPEAGRAAAGTRAIDAAARIENPLLRSGLALAGANLPRTSGDDGILTALEAANLNLWGTKLVTLSACDTGIGVVRNGEGVYGFRRAFFLAGAESLVMSLWPVSDLITREMMTGYYRGLKAGLGRGAALRRMQLQMLKQKGRSHPFYWASFIQAGDWGTLDGRR
jgi:CHAT domain-containing protein/tetratricopeptide (TPR) repeat protein